MGKVKLPSSRYRQSPVQVRRLKRQMRRAAKRIGPKTANWAARKSRNSPGLIKGPARLALAAVWAKLTNPLFAFHTRLGR